MKKMIIPERQSMPRKALRLAAVGIGLSALAACSSFARQPHPESTTMNDPKTLVLKLLKSIETGDSAALAGVNPDKYIQHNLGAADGPAGFQELLRAPKGSFKVDTRRVFQDGSFVFAHTDYNFFGPKVGFDIFRIEDGKIVEHWDNLQETPNALSPSGHSMLDGATSATDLEQSAANKALVARFLDDVLVHGHMEKMAGYFNGDHYIQHNPQIPDQVSGLRGAFEAMSKQGISVVFTKVHKILGEGNFVLAVSEGSFAGKNVAFYDLFRLHAGKIAEHWDVIEAIPPRAQWKNGNGKFGF
jgi:predicted SnoaL-like aldol condensation-catalyzing enzyme